MKMFLRGLAYNIPNSYFLLASMLCVVLYCINARKKKNPLFNLKMFSIKSFSIGMLGIVFVRLVGGSLPFIAPLFFQTALGFSPSKSGIALLPLGIAAMVAKPFVNTAIIKLGYKKFLFTITALLGVFLFLICFVTVKTPFWVILIIYSFIGLFNSFQYTSLNTLSLIDVPKKLISSANSVLSVFMHVSVALGVACSALIINYVSSFITIKQTNNLLETFHITYLIVAIFSFVSSFLFLLIPKKAGNLIRAYEKVFAKKKYF